MKGHSLFPEENKKNNIHLSSVEFAQTVVMVAFHETFTPIVYAISENSCTSEHLCHLIRSFAIHLQKYSNLQNTRAVRWLLILYFTPFAYLQNIFSLGSYTLYVNLTLFSTRNPKEEMRLTP